MTVTIAQGYQLIAIFIGLIGSGCLFTPYLRQSPSDILNSTSGKQSFVYGEKEVESLVQQNIINLLGWLCFLISFLLQAIGIFIKIPDQNIIMTYGLIGFILILCFCIAVLWGLYKYLYTSKLKEVHRLAVIEMCETWVKDTVSDEYLKALISWTEHLLKYERKIGETDEMYVKRICKSLNFNIPEGTSFP